MSSQYEYYINLLKNGFSLFFFNLRNFGIKFAFINLLADMARFYLFINLNFSKILFDKQDDMIYNILINKYSDFIEEYISKEIKIGLNSKKIWCFWWQGISNSPPIVQKCINNIEKYSGDYELVVLTKNNYRNYLDVPKEIVKKVDEGKISFTNFSDILRFGLLSNYGGVWIDSTMFVCDYIFNEFDDAIFNSCYRNHGWSSFFMGGKPNKLFSFVYDLLIKYSQDYDKFINYFLINYFVDIACNYFKECNEYVQGTTLLNQNIFYFIENFSKSYDEKEFNELCDNYKFFKLSYKLTKNYHLYDEHNNLTYYGYFMQNE